MIPECLESQESCVNYIESLNGSSINNFQTNFIYFRQCNKGYNYYSRSQIGNITVVKGTIPFAGPGAVLLTVDTSLGPKYSDYTFLNTPSGYKNFNRIDMKKNFRFYFRTLFENETLPTGVLLSKTYSTKPSKPISATLKLDNGISQTAYGQISFKSSIYFIK